MIPTDAPHLKSVVFFNHDGNIARRELYNNGDLVYVREYSYSNKGYSNNSRSKRKVKGMDTWIVSPLQTYTFNDKLHREETKGGSEPTMIGFYNPKGETDSTILYIKGGTRIQKISHKYDRGGNVIETNIYNGNDTASKRYTYQLDSQGRKLLEQWYDIKKLLICVISHKYDEHGNEIEYHESWNSDTDNRKQYTTVRLFKYKYDNHSNWIYREQFNDAGKLQTIVERAIVYY